MKTKKNKEKRESYILLHGRENFGLFNLATEIGCQIHSCCKFRSRRRSSKRACSDLERSEFVYVKEKRETTEKGENADSEKKSDSRENGERKV